MQSVIECCDPYGQGYPLLLKMEPGAQAGNCQASDGYERLAFLAVTALQLEVNVSTPAVLTDCVSNLNPLQCRVSWVNLDHHQSKSMNLTIGYKLIFVYNLYSRP